MSAKVVVIPRGGFPERNVGISQSFKAKVKNLWEEWMSNGQQHCYTKGGKVWCASYTEVLKWAVQAWNDISETMVKMHSENAKLLKKILTVKRTLFPIIQKMKHILK